MGRLLFDSGLEGGNALGSPSVVVTQASSSRSLLGPVVLSIFSFCVERVCV